MKTLNTQHIKTLGLSALLAITTTSQAAAQDVVELSSPRANWYVQAALDLSLQNPYGDNAGSAFKEGRTGGIVVAAGRWFTPAIGLRGRVNWENGFAPLYSKSATWLDFMHPEHLNADHGGYITVVGDVQLDIMGLACRYKADRLWRVQIFPRAGLAYNFCLQKGSPLIGGGVGNTFRLNERCTLFCDVAYQMVSSGFNGRGTDIGTGANAYLDAAVGIQVNLGRSGFKTSKKAQ